MSPNQLRAVSLSATSASPQPISFTGFLRHRTAQRLGHELPAQAMTEQRNVLA